MKSKVNKVKPTIFLVVGFQFTVRYLLKTNFYKKLHELGFKIVILSPNGLDDDFQKDYQLEGVYFEKLNLKYYKQYSKNLLYKYFSLFI